MIYSLVLLALLISANLSLLLKRRHSLPFGIVVVFLLSVFVGLRDPSVGQDTRNYIDIFLHPGRYKEFIEPGFIQFVALLGLFTNSSQLLLITLSSVINGLLLLAYRSILGRFALVAIFLFACTHVFWLFNIQVIRGGLAAALFLVAVVGLLNGRMHVYLVLGALAISVHYAATLPVLLAYIVSRVKAERFTPRAILAVVPYGVIMLAVIFLSGDVVTQYFGAYYEKYAHLELSKSRHDLHSSVGFQYLPSILLLVLTILRWRKLGLIYKRLYLIYLSICAASMVFWELVILRDRMFYFAQPLEPLMYVFLVVSVPNRRFWLLALQGVFVVWSIGVVFIWGPANILTHY